MGWTFGIIKPDAVANPFILGQVVRALNKNGLTVAKGCRVRLTREQAVELYSAHQSKFFFSRLIRHVCSGDVFLLRLEGSAADLDVIKKWRSTLGPSKFFANMYEVEGDFGATDHNNLRQHFSLSDYRNIGHGSDSIEERQREYALFEGQLTDVVGAGEGLFGLDEQWRCDQS